MLKNPPRNEQRASFDLTMDKALQTAFAPLLAEGLPLRLRAARQALSQRGSAYDTAKRRS